MTNKTICKFAWSSMTSTMIDTFRPCCRFPLDDNGQYPTTDQVIHNGISAFNNEFLNAFRQDLINGKPRKECEKCYVEESSNIESMRQKGNKNLTAITNTLHFDKLEFLEISLDNLCNLECRMCNSRFSTKLYQRDKLLFDNGLHEYRPASPQYKTLQLMDALDLTNLKMIKLLGGEPLISPNLFLFLDKIPYPENVELLIITNATTIPSEKILNKLKTFKSVRFDFSIDGIFQYNDYQRVGSDFETTVSNALHLAKIFPQQHSVHCVFSSVNIIGLNSSTEWFEKYLPFTLSIDVVSNNILSPYIAPDWYRELIIEKIPDDNPYKLYVQNLFEKNHHYDSTEWKKFLDFCQLTDSLYKTDIGKINPEVAKEIQSQRVNERSLSFGKINQKNSR